MLSLSNHTRIHNRQNLWRPDCPKTWVCACTLGEPVGLELVGLDGADDDNAGDDVELVVILNLIELYCHNCTVCRCSMLLSMRMEPIHRIRLMCMMNKNYNC
jgi:hypothetical protein